MTQLEFNSMFLITVSFLLATMIPVGTIMIKLNTTLNKLTFTLDVLKKGQDDHNIRLDSLDENIHLIQLNCAKQGHIEKRHP